MTQSQRRIVLTGGSGGLGRYVAAELEDDELIMISRAGPASMMRHVRHFAIDLSEPAGIVQASAIVAGEEPDLLINMAGVQYFGLAEQQPFDDLQRSYMINLLAPVALCQACLPAMKRRNAGHIVNIGSIIGSIALANFAAYGSAKAGLRTFSEALRRELAATAVTVTYVAPRATRTSLLTPEIQRYARITGMNIDAPEVVANTIMAAIRARKKEVFVGFPERAFIRLNALMPWLVDAALARNDRKAMQALSEAQSAAQNRGG